MAVAGWDIYRRSGPITCSRALRGGFKSACHLTLAHSCRVTEELILEQLRRYKIAISAGKLHDMLTENHSNFHVEKAKLGILLVA